MNILNEMKRKDVKQVDMIFKLRDRDLIVTPSELSLYLRGVVNTPKGNAVRKECEDILKEM